MKADLVADVGNSRVKWGLCADGSVRAAASLPADDPAAWDGQLRLWGVSGPLKWLIGSVSPANLDGFMLWLTRRGDEPRVLTRADLPLEMATEHPERVGIDRLLNAAAADARLRRGTKGGRRRPAVLIDAGTAVTVDRLSPAGVFEGGAIFPGRRLMAAALHDYTALLPLVAGESADPPPVGKNTHAAIEAGVYHAVAGGINQLIRRQASAAPSASRPAIFLTGGDAPFLAGAIDRRAIVWPEMTLEGLRVCAEALPS